MSATPPRCCKSLQQHQQVDHSKLRRLCLLNVRLAHGVGSMAWLVQSLLLTWRCDLLCQLTPHVQFSARACFCRLVGSLVRPKCEVHIWPPQTSIKASRSMPLMPAKQLSLTEPSRQCRPASKSHSHSAHRHFPGQEPLTLSNPPFPGQDFPMILFKLFAERDHGGGPHYIFPISD